MSVDRPSVDRPSAHQLNSIEEAVRGPEQLRSPRASQVAGYPHRRGGHCGSAARRNPNNPTGHTPTRAQLVTLLDLAARNGRTVFSDESYARYVHDAPGYLPQQLLRDRHPDQVTVTSLSKNYAFSHWRVAYVHAPARLTDRIHAAFEWDFIKVGDIPQIAAEAAVTGPQGWLDTVFSRFRERRDLLVRVLDEVGLPVVVPGSGIFAFADLAPFGRTGRELEDLLLG